MTSPSSTSSSPLFFPFFLNPPEFTSSKQPQKDLLSGFLKAKHPSLLVSYFLKEISKAYPQCLFIKYLPFRHLLLVTHEQGLSETKGQGLHLPSPHNEKDLPLPEAPLKNKKIKIFLKKLTKSTHFKVFPVQVLKELKGMFLIKHSGFSITSENNHQKEEELVSQLDNSIRLLSLVWENLHLSLKLHHSKYEQDFPFVLTKSFFLETLKKEFSRSRRLNQPVSLVLLSIDDFFQFRTQKPLFLAQWRERKMSKFLALFLQQKTRPYDWIGKLGPGEFGLILPHTNKVQAALVAERLRLTLKATNLSSFLQTEEEQSFHLSLSQGISEYPSHCQNTDEALKRADEALYQVKNQGKNKVCLAVSPYEGFKPDFEPHSH